MIMKYCHLHKSMAEEYAGIGKDSGQRRGMRSRGCWLVVGVAVVCVVLGLLVLVLALTLGTPASLSFREEFTTRCEAFANINNKRIECERVWSAFESAYVGKDPCNVPMEAYDALISVAPFERACNRMMFWSKTKDFVHEFTKKRHCYKTLEDTLLGYVMDGVGTWCGKEGSNETLTSGCPAWNECDNTAVGSFWNRASAEFAEAACGDVTSMLNGSIAAPFDASSTFANIEVQRFNATRVKSLNIVLVTQLWSHPLVTDCNNPTLQDLQKRLPPGLKYMCREVSKANISACASNPKIPCGACW